MDTVDRILMQWNKERPDLDVAPMGTIGRIKRLNQYLVRSMEEIWLAHGLNAASFDVLATLRRAGAPYTLSPGALMESTMVTSGTMTHRIDQLVKGGLVKRTRNPDDARGFLITLTQKGYDVIDAAVTEHVQKQASLVAVLSDAERTQLDGLLKRILLDFEAPYTEPGRKRDA